MFHREVRREAPQGRVKKRLKKNEKMSAPAAGENLRPGGADETSGEEKITAKKESSVRCSAKGTAVSVKRIKGIYAYTGGGGGCTNSN